MGSAVRIGGVQIGQVTSLRVDTDTYQALAVLEVDVQYSLPIDTQASIASGGLLSPGFVKLTPGKSTQRLVDGAQIAKTQSAVSLEELLGRVIFLATGSD